MLSLRGFGGLLLNKKYLSHLVYLLFLLSIWLLSHIHKSHLYLLVVASVLLAIKTKRLLLFYIFFEFSLIPITAIIFLYGYQPEKLQSALYMILYTVVGSLPLLLSIAYNAMTTLPVTLAFMVKSPLYIAHIWLPKAHVEAPVSGSMLLAGILLKLGSFGLVLFLPFLKMDNYLILYISLRLIGSIICALVCLRQSDSKMLIAYSSVVHIGIVNLALLRATEVGYVCATLIIICHGLCSPILFHAMYNLYTTSYTRLMIYNSLSPAASAVLFGLITTNASLPPRLGIWAEIYMAKCILIVFTLSYPFLVIILLLGYTYNLYFYLSFKRIGVSPPCWIGIQTILLCYLAFFVLDIFHV